MGKPSRDEIVAVMCALYELCTSLSCHVPLEAIRRLARLPGDRFSKTIRWLEKRGSLCARGMARGGRAAILQESY